MKTWARWTLLILWTALLVFTSQYWNPFTSFPALMKYSVTSVIASAIFGVLVMLMQFFILIAVIFPLPPRADSKARKSVLRQMFGFAFKDPPINPKAPKKLDELIGNEKAKTEIREVIDMLKNREHYLNSGADVPKGMLFIGQPGVGKTLFARAIANEADIPFYVVEGSAFSGVIYGLGVFKLKTLFRKLRHHKQAILFIDEIESMGSRRKEDKGFGAQADQNITLNTLLTEMDGFYGARLMVIGATNNDSMLDPALMRAGRMDRRIYFQPPGKEERKQLFEYYVSKVVHAPEIDYTEIVELTANYSPAEISSVINEAALIARRPGGENMVTANTIKLALENVTVGMERTLTSGVELITHDPSIRFDDVIGIDDAKQDVSEIVDFLKKGDELRKIGAIIPKGIMMIGPPGVGKTLLAKAIANEAGVPFYGISASYFSSFLHGEGAARIRALYNQARKNPASIVFIDEIDAIGGTMTEAEGNKRTTELNQILVELDGIGRSNVITLAATNVEQKLDPAFLRSGRFDRKLYIGLPDANARKKLFEKYLSKVKLANEVDLAKLAKNSFNFSGADVAASVNEAAMMAVRRGKKEVEEDDLEGAIQRVSASAGHKLNTTGINMSRVPDLDVKLDDIKGMEEAKAEAAEVVALLKHAEIVTKSGLKSPKGVLLTGAPGTGKTMLAKAIANEAGVAFYALSGTDFVQVFVGLGAQRVRAVYEQARRSGKPAIVFIDELDAIGAKRVEDRAGGGQNEVNRTLNQLLVEMDGFGQHKVLTIGATNKLDSLDEALLRAGRFDRIIEVPLPNLEGRQEIIHHYSKELELDSSLNILEVARMTVLSSGAELANIVNESGLIAIRNGRLKIQHSDMVQAIQRVRFGLNRSQQITLRDLRETAYHEAGHALVSYFRNELERIQVVTIIPTGKALGYTWYVSKDDKFHHSPNREEILISIEILLGGYVAEKLMLNTSTAGTSQDLKEVARLASSMVREFGMGSFKFNTENAGGETSYETKREIELEIKNIVDSCVSSVEKLIGSKKAELEKMAESLIEKETLYYADIVAILEPSKTAKDLELEFQALSERKLVGVRPVINMDFMAGLSGLKKNGKGSGSNGNGKAPVTTGNGHGISSNGDGTDSDKPDPYSISKPDEES